MTTIRTQPGQRDNILDNMAIYQMGLAEADPCDDRNITCVFGISDETKHTLERWACQIIDDSD